MDVVNEYLADSANLIFSGMFPVRKAITCTDGYTISIQASQGAYCQPRENYGPWYMVECGFPNRNPSQSLMEYAEDKDNPRDTVYGYVPVEVVVAEIEKHGGIAQ